MKDSYANYIVDQFHIQQRTNMQVSRLSLPHYTAKTHMSYKMATAKCIRTT